jgi:hypothetical protein
MLSLLFVKRRDGMRMSVFSLNMKLVVGVAAEDDDDKGVSKGREEGSC